MELDLWSTCNWMILFMAMFISAIVWRVQYQVKPLGMEPSSSPKRLCFSRVSPAVFLRIQIFFTKRLRIGEDDQESDTMPLVL
ncbi:hypothetical protein [Thermoflavimicrobium dichotomicum]|uniref:Uncharacterized protein n=1 Tax=Thermoflavimicrobium dichotomicum TaxID=46223 RepID=A0A1I3JGF2_9BACL|nr:hypothetical protein [Thermoflavimicrobium dichotomicum]SFI59327.1 hypothetical protein SAMN05421852_10168 [Thermoflavimicrobium dichotomicum]